MKFMFSHKFKEKWDTMSIPVKASVAFVICSFLQRGISALTVPIFTRLLTTEQYGYFSVFNSWLDIVSVFTTFKLAGGVFTQAIVKHEKTRDKYTSSIAGLGTTLTIIATLIYFPLRSYINGFMGVSTLVMFCILASCWASLIFELWAVRQRVDYKYKALVALTMFTTIAKPIAGVFAILVSPTEFKVQARILSIVTIELISYTWIFITFLKEGKSFYNNEYWKYSLSLNIPLIPHYLARTVLNQSDRLMIRAMVDYSSAGIYSLAYNLAWMLSLFTNAILNSFNPWIYQRIKDKNYKRLSTVSYELLVIVSGIGVVLIAFAPELVRLFAPKEYFDAIWVIPPVTASVYFLFMYSLFADFEFYFEETKTMSFVSTFGGLLNIGLNFVCIKAFGFIAAGYTTLICYMFFAVAHYMAMKKILKNNLDNIKVYNVWIIVLISLSFLIISGIMMILYNYAVIRYALIILSLMIVLLNRSRILSVINEIRKNKA